MRKLFVLFCFITKVCIAQNDCNLIPEDLDTIEISDGLVGNHKLLDGGYNPVKLCYDHFSFFSKENENLLYTRFESFITDTTTSDTIARSGMSPTMYFSCNVASFPSYLAYRLIFDPGFTMVATKAVKHIIDNYSNKGLHVNFYFTNKDSVKTILKRKFIYQYTPSCDFVTGIDIHSNREDLFNVYPNPSQSGIFNLKSPDNLPANVFVYCPLGQNYVVNVRSGILDLSGFDPGIYSVQFFTGNKRIIRKLVIN